MVHRFISRRDKLFRQTKTIAPICFITIKQPARFGSPRPLAGEGSGERVNPAEHPFVAAYPNFFATGLHPLAIAWRLITLAC